MIVKCDWCGKAVKKTQYQLKEHAHQFCSRECYWYHKRKRVKTNCSMCGSEVTRSAVIYKKNNNNFCSKKCYHKSRENKIKFNCDYCGKESEKVPKDYNRNKHHYCSRKCMGKSKRKSLIIKCDWCSKEFTKRQHQVESCKNHFCSWKCYKLFLGRNKKHGMCEWCGVVFEKHQSRKKYCSRKCQIASKKYYGWVDYKCDFCGKAVRKVLADYSKAEALHFCDNKCNGKYIPKVYELKRKIGAETHGEAWKLIKKSRHIKTITKEVENAKS